MTHDAFNVFSEGAFHPEMALVQVSGKVSGASGATATMKIKKKKEITGETEKRLLADREMLTCILPARKLEDKPSKHCYLHPGETSWCLCSPRAWLNLA